MVNTKKLLVTGSNGMLGKDVVAICKQNNYDLYTLNRTIDNSMPPGKSIACDLTNTHQLISVLEIVKPDIIIHCAAMVDVEGCEKNREYAYKLNVESTKVLSGYNSNQTKFIYVSTDSVFDGQMNEYFEVSIKNPLNYYATTKSVAEDFARRLNKNSIIIRTNIYGFHNTPGKSLVEWAVTKLVNNNEISGFQDVYFNPVYTKQLSRVIIQLLQYNYQGIINVGVNKKLSKYEFLQHLAHTFCLDSTLIRKANVDDIAFKAKRPKNTFLSTKKLQKVMGITLDINDGINELLNDYCERYEINSKYEGYIY